VNRPSFDNAQSRDGVSTNQRSSSWLVRRQVNLPSAATAVRLYGGLILVQSVDNEMATQFRELQATQLH